MIERPSFAVHHRVRALLTAGLAVFAFLTIYPVRYLSVSTSFDAIWATTLNIARSHGLVFGRDLIFTYGPLSYLSVPMPYRTNLEQSIVLQFACWFAFGGVLFWLVRTKRVSTWNLAVLAMCAPAGARLFRASSNDGPDYLLELLVLLFAGASLVGPWTFLVAAVILAVLLLLIKLSTGIAAVGFLLLLPVALAFTDRKRAARFLLIVVTTGPIILAGMFVAFCGPISALPHYLRAGFEITSGYDAGMAYDNGSTSTVWCAYSLLSGFGALAVMLFLQKDRAFPVAFAACAPVFLELKHSIVRQDTWHEGLVFLFAPLVLSTILLFSDLTFARRNLLARSTAFGWLAVSMSLIVPWLYNEFTSNYRRPAFGSPFAFLEDVETLRDWGGLKEGLKKPWAAGLERLPDSLLVRIGNRSVAIYPWKASYAAANPIRLSPFPVLQAYSAYTTYLDHWNATFLDDPHSRPDFVLMEWYEIDQRHPLLECPQTAFALFRNYEFDSVYENRLLLRARTTPLPGIGPLVRETTMATGEPLHAAENGQIVRIFLKPSLRGRLLSFLVRTPAVYVTLSGPRGWIRAKVPPSVAAGGIPLMSIPVDFSDLRRLFETGQSALAFDTIAISGPGVASFEPTAHVEIFAWSASSGPHKPLPVVAARLRLKD